MAELNVKLPEFLHWQDGEVRLVGHRISLFDVVARYEEGQSVERIALDLPTLSLLEIHKTIAFYLEYQAEVSRYVEDCLAVLERMSEENPTEVTLEELRQRLHAQRQSGVGSASRAGVY